MISMDGLLWSGSRFRAESRFFMNDAGNRIGFLIIDR
jgi:hypothetical protein